MKILYAIQGTGNGHLSRAMDVIPCLNERGAVDVLLSGTQADLQLPFPVKFRRRGLSFVFGKTGGVDLWRTFMRTQVQKFLVEINTLPVHEYDLVISDFEPISAWACNVRDKPCIALSHQYAVLAPEAPKPREVDVLGRFILKNYAPPTTGYGFHFQSYNSRIFTPVIRRQVRQLEVANEGHITVYLPAYDDQRLIKYLSQFPEVQWQIFSKHNRQVTRHDRLTVYPIDNDRFIESMAKSAGVLCGAGFETPAEALYLKKKLLVIPMKNQYEQHLNAAALEQMGVEVLRSLNREAIEPLRQWLREGSPIPVNYPDQTQQVVDRILQLQNLG